MSVRCLARCACAVSPLVLCAAATAAPPTVLFEDKTFNPGDYIELFSAFPGGQTVSQDPVGGNSATIPDPFRRVQTITSNVVRLSHLNTGFVIDPGVTPILSVDFSIDTKAFSAFGQGMAYGLAAEQNGIAFEAASQITGSAPGAFSWNSFSVTGLVAASFSTEAGGPQTLDFSATGSPITFGFRTANSGGTGITVGYDNLRIVAHVVPSPPAAMTLVGVGALTTSRRRRRS